MNTKQHARLLKDRLRAPMEPQATGMQADSRLLPGLRAVIFDIYGTLFVSGSGDVGVAAARNRSEALAEAIRGAGVTLNAPALAPDLLETRFTAAVKAAQDAVRERGIEFPEVEIREVWAAFLSGLIREGLVQGPMPGPDALETLCIDYECRVNPVWPMPGLAHLHRRLHDSHLLCGIVSNAQFFTPPLFNCFLGRGDEELDFEPCCTVYSFRLLEAKPSARLFHRILEGLREHGFRPDQALYVGNDMRNDIAPAAAAGLHTCLFAGDARSLRLREGDPLVQGVTPDRVITELTQLFEILGVG